MKKLVPLLCILFSFSCGNSQSNTTSTTVPENDTIDIFSDTVNSIDNNKTELNVKGIEDLLHEKYFKDVQFRIKPERSVTENLDGFWINDYSIN